MGLGELINFGTSLYSGMTTPRGLSNDNPIPRMFRSRVTLDELAYGEDYYVKDARSTLLSGGRPRLKLTPRGQKKMVDIYSGVKKKEAAGDFSRQDEIADAMAQGKLGLAAWDKMEESGRLTPRFKQMVHAKAPQFLSGGWGTKDYLSKVGPKRQARDEAYSLNKRTAQNVLATSPGGGKLGNLTSRLTTPQVKKKRLLGGA